MSPSVCCAWGLLLSRKSYQWRSPKRLSVCTLVAPVVLGSVDSFAFAPCVFIVMVKILDVAYLKVVVRNLILVL